MDRTDDTTKPDFSSRDISLALRLMLDDIYRQRKEVLEAFIAKYGCEPDECEQVIVSGPNTEIRWFVQKKSNPKEGKSNED